MCIYIYIHNNNNNNDDHHHHHFLLHFGLPGPLLQVRANLRVLPFFIVGVWYRLIPGIIPIESICAMVESWIASGLRLPRSEVGRWPLSNWAMQFTNSSSADPRVCDPIAFGVPLPLSSDLCFDFDRPSGGCYWIFRGSVVRSCGYFSSLSEISVSSVAWDWSQVASTWHHRPLPLEDDTWTMEQIDVLCLLAYLWPGQASWNHDRWWRCDANTWMQEPKPLLHGVCR